MTNGESPVQKEMQRRTQGQLVERFNDNHQIGATILTSHGLHYEAKGATIARAELEKGRATVLCMLEGDIKSRRVPLDKLTVVK